MQEEAHNLFVIPGLPRLFAAEPDCICRIANANAEGGPKGECQGWRESTQ